MNFSTNRWLDFLGGGIATGGALLCLTSLCPYAARLHWFLDLFSHFRMQMAVGLLVCAVAMALYRRPRIMLVFILFLCLHLIEIIPFYLPAPASDSSAGAVALQVTLINVNSSTGNPDRVVAYLQKGNADIIILQEYSSRWLGMAKTLRERYPFQTAEMREDNFGMAIFSKQAFISQETFYFNDKLLPSLGVEFTWGGERIFLVGDLNTSPWSPVFKDLRQQSGLKNSMQGFGIQPTWPSFIPPLWTPLDHLLHSENFKVLDRKTGPHIGSDHYPVEVTLQLNE